MRHTFAAALLFAALAVGQPQPQLVWEGEADGVHVLHIRGNRLDVDDRQGVPVQRDRHRFFERLPELRQDVQMKLQEGRGSVRILQQPRPENNFTLSVQIEDKQGGSAFYSLSFYWQTSSRSALSFPAPGRSPLQGGGGRATEANEERLTWSGRVDDEVIVECRGQDCRAQTLRGSPATRDRVSFTRPLPERDVRVSLDGVEGRGQVQLAEHPSASNGYTARVRIRDDQGGTGDYTFSLYWTRPARNQPDRLFASAGMTWQGRVDGKVRVMVDGSSASTEVLEGGAVRDERVQFVRPLPNAQAPNATVRKVRGRGRVEIVDFPSRGNGYRLVFEINDSSGGADFYEVEVGW
jgi:hypothetical protein